MPIQWSYTYDKDVKMSSCNFLPPRLMDMNRNSDTLSEVSESGTTTSGWNSNWDSREELRDFVNKLGLKDVSDLYQDRFRVDRKKLEQMLTVLPHVTMMLLFRQMCFFAKIMEDTDTYITWPNKLKIGAKSKKDPHVRIAGRPEDVQAAKERIMTILDTRCNRVTMKMDVSYTDHSHIIGKGGLASSVLWRRHSAMSTFQILTVQIRQKRVTRFPYLAISRGLSALEVVLGHFYKELIPLIFGFELPIMSQNVDVTSPYVVKIQEQYKVQVMFKTRPKLHATLVLVKGVEWEVDQVKHATLLLMEFMCDKLANQMPVQMSMEISPHHHQVVLGKNHSNLKAIMQYTNCQIMFPDAQDPNIPNLKKSNVTITGNIHNVYKARQLLMGSLPLIIIFDIPEDSSNLKTRPDQLAEIQTSSDLIINIRQKAKQNTKACVVKGIERHAVNIYMARNLILGIDEPPLQADIPSSYHMPLAHPQSPFPASDLLPTPTNTNPPPLSPMLSPLITPTWQYPMPTTNPNAPPFVGMVHQPQFLYNVMQQSMGSSGYQSMSHSQFSASSLSLEQSRENSTYSSISSNNSSISPLSSPRNSLSPNFYRHFSESPSEKMELSSVLSEMSLSAHYQGPTVDKKQDRGCLLPPDYENKRLAGLRAMRTTPVAGSCRVPNNSWSGYCISHTSPASLPEQIKSKKDEDIWKAQQSDIYNLLTNANPGGSGLNTSNILDHTPTHILNSVTSSKWSDLPNMLTSLGLREIHKCLYEARNRLNNILDFD
ncbi:hypothetical protein NQ317_013299 [Molorchus minor]|uniref:K Homology domain-containing protein n=1 Tax=Molorchus minor TaxID=1323400 RepID=A0ABQ9JGZ6_9CUCU|nr:hypothetical protein NQ317_013299 [Molorchus minor]